MLRLEELPQGEHVISLPGETSLYTAQRMVFLLYHAGWWRKALARHGEADGEPWVVGLSTICWNKEKWFSPEFSSISESGRIKLFFLPCHIRGLLVTGKHFRKEVLSMNH